MTLEAMEIGAVDVIAKPGSAYTVGDMSSQLADKIRGAAWAKVIRKDKEVSDSENVPLKALSKTSHKVIAIGASTGGTEALKMVLYKITGQFTGDHGGSAYAGEFYRCFCGTAEFSLPTDSQGGQ